MAYWTPTRQTDMDDVFDDEAEDELVVRKEWDRAESDIRKSGYRIGLSAGEEETLQQGFDAGYKESSAIAFALGCLQGKISASMNLMQMMSSQDPASTQHVSHKTDPGLWMALLEDCTQLLRTLPHTVIDSSRQFHTAPQPHNSVNALVHAATATVYDTGGRTFKGVNGDFTVPTHTSQDNTDELGELTALLNVCGVQDLPPIRDPMLKQTFVDLLRRYQVLCGC